MLDNDKLSLNVPTFQNTNSIMKEDFPETETKSAEKI
jgi:hypothetical protein